MYRKVQLGNYGYWKFEAVELDLWLKLIFWIDEFLALVECD